MMDRADVKLVDGKWHWEAKDADGNILLSGDADTEQEASTQIGEVFPNQGSIYFDHE